MRLAVVGLALWVGCDTGYGLRVDVEQGCAMYAARIRFSVTSQPGGATAQTADVDAPQFFSGGHEVVVVPPDGATSIDFTATATDGAGATIATVTIPVSVEGHQIAQRTVRFTVCQGAPGDMAFPVADGAIEDFAGARGDGAGAADQSMAPAIDQATSPPDLTTMGGMPDLAMRDLSSLADLARPPDLTPPSPDLAPPDLAPPVDLTIPPDLTPPDFAIPPDFALGEMGGGGCLRNGMNPPMANDVGNFLFMFGACIGKGGPWKVCNATCGGAMLSNTGMGDFDLDAICRQLGYSNAMLPILTMAPCGKPSGLVLNDCDQMCGGPNDYCMQPPLTWTCVP